VIYKIFSVRDSQVEAFLQPFFSPTTGSAIRSIAEVVNDPQHTFNKHAADYALYHLGDFDDTTGAITPNPIPQVVNALIDLLKAPI